METHKVTDANGNTTTYRDSNDNTRQQMDGYNPSTNNSLNDQGDCLSRLLPFIVVGIIFTTEIVNLVIS